MEDHQEALEEEKQKEAKFFDTEKERGLEHPDTLAAFFELSSLASRKCRDCLGYKSLMN